MKAKKGYTQDNPFDSSETEVEARDVAELTTELVDNALYGKPSLPTGQRMAPIALDTITPDPTQPRREVPVTVRRKAKAEKLPEWLVWYQMAERLAGKEIPLTALLRGECDAPESAVGEDDTLTDGKPREIKRTGKPLVDDFMELVSLAASIYRDGLANAITVTSRGMDRYQIETGERRYQAFKLLYGALQDEKFARIPARVVDKVDIWRQAAENGSRKPLNAIGMARQLALLIMELNKGRDGISYLPFDKFESECDRAFYAQVADGNIHRIPKGSSERILQATGLKSQNQIAQYRKLLDLTDEQWMTADEEGWTEFKIRESVRPPSQKTNTITDSYGTAIREGHIVGANAPIVYPLDGPGVRYATVYGKPVMLSTSTDAKTMTVWLLDDNGQPTYTKPVPMGALQDIRKTLAPTPTQGTPFTPPPLSYAAIGQGKAGKIEIGQRRRNTILNRVFEVMTINGTETECFEINVKTGERLKPSTPFKISLERLLEMELYQSPANSIPDWLTVGKIVIHNHDNPDYRVKGPITSVKYDGDNLGYLVMIKGPDGKSRGLYSSKALRPDDGKEPGPYHRFPEDYDQPDDRIEDPAAPADGDDPLKNIFQHFKTGRLYRIVTLEGNGSEIARPCDANGTMTGNPERFRMGDLVLYQRVYDHLPATETPVDDEGFDDETEGEIEPDISAEDALTQIEQGRAQTDTPTFTKGMQVITPQGIHGTVFHVWNNTVDVALPPRGVTESYPAKSLQLAPIDESPSDEPANEPPLWAVYGAVVRHTDTGKICDVLGTVWSDEDGLWMVRVTVRGGGDQQHDIAVREFVPLSDDEIAALVAPRPRHPGMDAANLTRVICNEQFSLDALIGAATALKMYDEGKLVNRMKVHTPQAIDAFLHKGEEFARTEQDKMWHACTAIIDQLTRLRDVVYTSHAELLTQKIEALHVKAENARLKAEGGL